MLRRPAEVWQQSNHLYVGNEIDVDIRKKAVMPPPVFQPNRDEAVRTDTYITDSIVGMKDLVEHKLHQGKGSCSAMSRFISGLKRYHPYVNMFTEFTGLHTHQQAMILMVNVMSAIFTQALLFDFNVGDESTEKEHTQGEYLKSEIKRNRDRPLSFPALCCVALCVDIFYILVATLLRVSRLDLHHFT